MLPYFILCINGIDQLYDCTKKLAWKKLTFRFNQLNQNFSIQNNAQVKFSLYGKPNNMNKLKCIRLNFRTTAFDRILGE